MKFLIDGQRKVLRRGEYVKADESAHEFIYDTDLVEDDKDVTVAVLKSIAEKNGIHVNKSSTRADLIANLNTHLPKLDVKEQNTMSQSDIITAVVTEAGANRDPEMDSDTFEIEIFTACIERLNKDGVSFKIKQLGNLVKKEIAEQGLMITASQRKEQINDILEEAQFAPEDYSEVEEMIERLCVEVQDTDHKVAAGAIRRWAKANEVSLPKRTTKKKRVPLRQRVIDFIIDNSPVTDEALMEFIESTDHKEPEKLFQRIGRVRDTIDAAYAAGVASVQDNAKAA